MASPKPSPALVLFDIDGTLLRRSGPHHRQVLEEAVWRTLRCKVSTDGIPVQGMLDGAILTQMMQLAGVPSADIRRAMPEIQRSAQALYVRRCPDLRDRVCPGVPELLHTLNQRGALLALVTGNLSRIGWKKMERAGLKKHFRFGSFAEAAPTRAQLARLAIARARHEGWITRRTPITLIGDHINDVLAAQKNRIRSVAVATGLVSIEELRAYAPDVAVPDLQTLPVEFLISP